VPDVFHGDETLLTSDETPSFSLLVISPKLMIFNAMKFFMKALLRLTLSITCLSSQYIFLLLLEVGKSMEVYFPSNTTP